jgi:phosphate transport system protein
MPVKFDAALGEMMKTLDTMAVTSERMVRSVVSTLRERKPELLQSVCEDEQKMDMFQREVDDTTVEMIGVYTPVAADLRLLLMIARVNGELERIGDQAVNISYIVRDLVGKEPLKPLDDIPRMADTVMEMIRKAFHAFRTRSLEGAIAVLKSDNMVDEMHDKLNGRAARLHGERRWLHTQGAGAHAGCPGAGAGGRSRN